MSALPEFSAATGLPRTRQLAGLALAVAFPLFSLRA
jgi:hypothetical protein